MRQVIGTRIIGELRARMDKEAADKKCSVSELIRQKIIFAYEQEDKEKTIIDLQKMDGFGPNIAQAIVDWFNNPTNFWNSLKV